MQPGEQGLQAAFMVREMGVSKEGKTSWRQSPKAGEVQHSICIVANQQCLE